MNDFPLLGSIDIPALASVLNGNSIDYTLEEDREGREESLYVTEFAFPYWFSLDNEQKWTCNGFVPVTYLIMPPWLRTRAG